MPIYFVNFNTLTIIISKILYLIFKLVSKLSYVKLCVYIFLPFFKAFNTETVLIFILPTYDFGSPPPSGEIFYKWLNECSNDFRVEKTYLKGIKYAVFGLGNSQYKDSYNVVSKNF